MEVPKYTIRGTNTETQRKKTVYIQTFDEDDAIQQAEAQGIVAPYEITLLAPNAPTERQLAYARDIGIRIPDGASSADVSRLISAVTEEDIDLTRLGVKTGQGWFRWSSVDHNSVMQKDRQDRARSDAYRPIKLFTEKREGVFKASQMDAHYLTSLEDCQCMDYMKRCKPCKHMYRLAHELGVFDLSVSMSRYGLPNAQAVKPTHKQSRQPTYSID